MKNTEKPTLFNLFFCFFKIGLFTFGGGFAMIPIMERELVEKNHWVKKKDFINSIAITQSVPGAIAFNLSVYFGHSTRGLVGALVSVIGVAMPSVMIILLIAVFFSSFSEIVIVQNMFKGIRPAVVSLILYAALNIAKHLKWQYGMVIVFTTSLFVSLVFSVNPMYLIMLAFALGILVYFRNKKSLKGKKDCGKE